MCVLRKFASIKSIIKLNYWSMKKIYLSILMTLCPLLPGMAQQLSQHGRDTVGQLGLRASAAYTPMPFLQEGKEWYTRCVHYFLGESTYK